MRGIKEAEKDVSPMFPRLHVNDTEKGGPRAPPRNKMALYEQLSIPSQRFSSGSPSVLPRPQNTTSSLVSSTSSGQASAYLSKVSPICNSPAPAYLAEKLHFNSSGGPKLDTVMADHEQKSKIPTNFQSSEATGLLATAQSNSSQTCNFSNGKTNFSLNMPGNEDNVRVSTSGQGVVPICTNSQLSKESQKLLHLSLSSTLHHKNPCENQKDRHLVKNHFEDPRVSQTSQDPVEASASIPVARERDIKDASSCPSTAVNNSERSKRGHASLNQGNNNSRDILSKLHGTKAQPHEEYVALCDKVTPRDKTLVEPLRGMVREISSKVRLASESCSRQLLGDDSRNPDRLENGSKFHEEKNCRTPIDKHDDVLEISTVEAISALNVRPDDVVGVMGEKQFWKARRTITYQQRIFAVQVFELHRLIKVQKSIAGSPQVLHEDSLYLHNPKTKASPVKKTPSEYVIEPSAPIVKPKIYPQNPDPDNECAQEEVVRKLPLPSVNSNNTSKGLITQQSNSEEQLRNPPAVPSSMNKSVAWPFHPPGPPPGNQWLVPVMSPSEGLVYKPYAGPCPPTAGFAVPNYGSCGPMSLNPGSTYGGPACNHQGIGVLPGTPPVGQTYFPPPYGLPVMNPFVSNSAVEQMVPFGVGCPNEQEYLSSFEEFNFTKPHQGSCNISSQMSRAMSCCGEAFQTSKGSQLQRSTTSSSSERSRSRGDALPLFPVAPAVEEPEPEPEPEPDQNNQTSKHQTRVIKVIPHNPISATESAARIFRSIQEERKHLRLVSS